MSQTKAACESSPAVSVAEWKELVARFQEPSTGLAIRQVLNTFVPFAALWYVMYVCAAYSLWLALPFAVVAGAFLVRIFIIFHDCGHGSFFKSRSANAVLGFISGLLTFTPYFHWRWEHSLHHATSGDLDRRGTGDIWTLTVEEYLASSRLRRFGYRLTRNPVILFVIGPLYLFLIRHRIPSRKASLRERMSVWWMNLALVCLVWAMSSIFGFGTYLVLQVTAIAVAGAGGVWLFYVQHQFDGVYWERGDEWDFTAAALDGSSYYKLPRILQWFSGNIGFHHIHHLSPRIANYNLERCHNSHPLFSSVKAVTLLGSLKSMTYRLWDEKQRELVGYRRLREIRRSAGC